MPFPLVPALGALAALLLFKGGSRAAESKRVWPVVPNRGVINGFGASREEGARLHAGVDLGANPGDEIVAIGDGEVVSKVTGYELGAGLGAVLVRHGDVDAIYAEIDVDPSLYPGQKLSAGEHIGVVRRNSYGTSMLHLEIWERGKGPKGFVRWLPGSRPDGLLDGQAYVEEIE